MVRTMTLPDRFIDQASPAEMYAEAGLTRGRHRRDAARIVGESWNQRRVNGAAAADLTLAFRLTPGSPSGVDRLGRGACGISAFSRPWA